MAANRKLQAEIDRTLKKVQEGVDYFDEIWEKGAPAPAPHRGYAERRARCRINIPPFARCAVYSAQNANQKEKFEAELKSQIKKLQRYRDDIKTWITNSDIKDKRPLTDARKQIETEMERFKVCEKEFKTKAFSKEGLSQAPKEDPKDKERNKVRKWIAASLSKITEQVDVYEAEIELAANEKKKKSKGKEATKWEDLIERCRFHEEKLEVVLRLIDNDSLSPADVESVQDQLDYLLEQMGEGNYEEVESIDDEGIYEELGLDELQGGGDDDDDHGGGGGSAPAPTPVPEAPKGKAGAALTTKEKKAAEKAAKEEEERKKKEKAASTETALPSINASAMKAPIPKPTKDAPPLMPPAKAPAAKPMPAPAPALAAQTARGKAAAQVPLTAQQQPARGRAAQADQQGLLARAGLAPAAVQGAPLGRQQSNDAKPSGLPPPMSPAARGGLASGGGAAAGHLPAGLPPPASRGGAPAPTPTPAPAPTPTPADGAGGLPPPMATRIDAKPAAAGGGGGLAGMSAGAAAADAAAAPSDPAARSSLVPGGGQPSGSGSSASRQQSAGAEADGGMFDGDDAYEELSEAETQSGEDAMRALQALNASLSSMPQPADSERPKTYVPRNPYPTPNSFPQTPAAVFDSPAVFEKFDTDTLFFIFYYQQGTYQQYLAARELKKQSWRYHKKYLTWFQRHEEPKVTADEYEQGTYVYFDYETGWCQRIKSEFTFEYGYLEDELQV